MSCRKLFLNSFGRNGWLLNYYAKDSALRGEKFVNIKCGNRNCHRYNNTVEAMSVAFSNDHISQYY